METRLRPRVVVDLLSDDGDSSPPLVGDKQRRADNPEYDGVLLDELEDAGPFLLDPRYDVLGRDSPIFGQWPDELLSPVAEAEDWPQIFQQTDVPGIAPNLKNQTIDQFGNNPFLEAVNCEKSETRDPVRELSPGAEMRDKARYLEGVLEIFPDICTDYVTQLLDQCTGKTTVENIVELIFQGEEKGESYPKAKQLKRKREIEEDDQDGEQKYAAGDLGSKSHLYRTYVLAMLSSEFSTMPMTCINTTLSASNFQLYRAYQTLAEIERQWNPVAPSYRKLKQTRKKYRTEVPDATEEAINDPKNPSDLRFALAELKAARGARARIEAKLESERKHAADEAMNTTQAMQEGTMQECGCCFGDFPRNRMVHCNNESEIHWFCKDCSRLNAETQIGQAKYELQCMSTDGCEGGYSYKQRELFLNEKLTIALDRIEAEAVLRMAGIENLESCPFCSYAAEYPPVESERLFHCQRELCEKISCRLCKKDAHIPKTCAEYMKELGLSARREVEEAMTSAVIRLCNKCKAPFIKDEGCNKMSCKCGNVQCYVCSESCTYNHFDDPRRGGKSGNCPLFDDVEKRHQEESQKAAAEIMKKLRAEHPEYTEEDLEITVSDKVKADEENRKKKHVQVHARLGYHEHRHRGNFLGHVPDLMLNRAQNRDDLVPGAQRPEIGDIFHEMGIGIREMGNGLREMGIGMQEIGIGLRQDRLPAAPQDPMLYNPPGDNLYPKPIAPAAAPVAPHNLVVDRAELLAARYGHHYVAEEPIYLDNFADFDPADPVALDDMIAQMRRVQQARPVQPGAGANVPAAVENQVEEPLHHDRGNGAMRTLERDMMVQMWRGAGVGEREFRPAFRRIPPLEINPPPEVKGKAEPPE